MADPLVLAAALLLSPDPLPPWWIALQSSPRWEARFVQESESTVFGSLKRKGTLRVARGGRLRMDYQDGRLLVADGATLVLYDPDARTAQRLDLRAGSLEAPLLRVFVDPASLSTLFETRLLPSGRLLLVSKKSGTPDLELEGKDSGLCAVRWTDPTGARQQILFEKPGVPARGFPESSFRFQAPEGTRWIR